MKVLFAIKALDAVGGGAERVLCVVASGLAARGHEVTAVSFDAPGGKSFYPLDARVRRIALGVGPTDRRTDAKSFVARARALRRVVRRENPDVAVGFMHSTFVPLAFALAGSGIPVVASEHIVAEHYRGRRTEYALLVAACLMARRVTVLSNAARDGYHALVRGRMVAIPNPVVPVAAARADRDRGGDRTVLGVGRLEAQKDHATLIDAFALIANRFPDWKVRIVGEGTLRDELAGKISALGLEGRVQLAGWADRIEDEYAAAHVLAVPSRYESFGLATAEALTAGLPVIGFADCPGTNELIQHGENGWLVTVGDQGRARAFAQGLEVLMSSDERRRALGERARRSVESFDPEQVVEQWERLLQDVAAR